MSEMDAADFVAMRAKKTSKYAAVKHEEDGYTFDSGAELKRYRELKLMRQAGAIEDLTVHRPRYDVVVNGLKITHYTPDFTYFDIASGNRVIEDVKSMATKTRAYVMRKKLIKALFDIEIVEVKA